MRNISTILSVIALVAVGVLYYLDFSGTKKLKDQINTQTTRKDTASLRIAYFDIDSLQTNYLHFKDAENRMAEEEGNMTAKLNDLAARNQKKLMEWESKKNSMTQAEYNAALQESDEMRKTFQQTEYTMKQKLQKIQMDLMTKIRKDVEEFLIDFNKQKGYTYVFAYQPNNLIYYKDSVNDITAELISGLNAQYKASRKK